MPPAPGSTAWPSSAPAPGWARRHCGVGWRAGHEDALRPGAAAPGFIEVHSENFFGEGSAARRRLLRARQDHAVSLHGVGLGLGSAAGLDPAHLDALARLVQQVQPLRVSDHAAFARAPQQPGGPVLHASDLLPLAFTEASLRLLVAQVQQVQDRLRRPLLVENLSAYLRWARPEMDEAEFFNRLVRHSGCGLLLDLNNLVVNARNDLAAARGSDRPELVLEGDPALQANIAGPHAAPHAAAHDDAAVLAQVQDFLQRLNPQAVQQVHLAGHGWVGGLAIDDHGSAVPPLVWQAYRALLARTGPVPTLVEWDTRLPPFEVLLAEADQAALCLAEVLGRQAGGPAAPAAFDNRPNTPQHTAPAPLQGPLPVPGGLKPPAAPMLSEPPVAPRPGPAHTGPHRAASSGLVLPQACHESQRQQALVAALWQPVGSAAAAAAEAALRPWLDAAAWPTAWGLRAYRGHARALAPRALAQVYPAVAALVGARAWAQLARRHWLAHPPQRGDLGEWGSALPAALAADERLTAWPWLADVARLELAVHRAERADPAEAASASAGATDWLGRLAEADPARCGLRLAPGSALCDSAWPVLALWQAHQGGGPADLAPARALLAAGLGQRVWVWRWAGAVQVRAVPAGDAACLQALLDGQPLAEAMDAAEARQPGWRFDDWLHEALRSAWCAGLQPLG